LQRHRPAEQRLPHGSAQLLIVCQDARQQLSECVTIDDGLLLLSFPGCRSADPNSVRASG
jgi:hypothetical protein